jgi:acyl carrier protein
MGCLDENQFLYISGRSKEIINRGGETISPFEIEEAIVQHPFVKETLAFSAPHARYQETVGVIVVTRDRSPRVDLPTLHKYLESRLHRSKWPQILIYMNGLPKNLTGKILRIRFAERAGIKDVDEESSPLLRMYEGICPKVGTPLTEPITIAPIDVSFEKTEQFLSSQRGVLEAAVVRVDLPFRPDALVGFVVVDTLEQHSRQPLASLSSPGTNVSDLQNQCTHQLDSYLVPAFLIEVPALPKTADNVVDRQALTQLSMKSFAEKSVVAPRNGIETQIEAVWREHLGSASIISVKDSFFDIGGDSLMAGQLVNAMRKKLQIQLSVADLFTASTIEALAFKVSTMKTLGSPAMPDSASRAVKRKLRKDSAEDDPYLTSESLSPLSNKSFSCLFIQSLPLLIIYPLRRISMWFLIAAPWVYLMQEGYGRFNALVIAMLAARLATGLLAPMLAVFCKWIIVGTYTPGRYPLWGAMYLKWWLVEQIINIMGKGYYRDDIPIVGQMLSRFYYRMMGAKIGKNVRIHRDAKLGQFDLLTIDDDVAIDNAVVRAFGLEEVS